MPLSPLTSYYVRRLLRRNKNRLSLVGSPVDVSPLSFEDTLDTNLDRVQQGLRQQSADVGTMGQQLETLVSLHQALEPQGHIYSKDLASVEQAIFRLLGFCTLDDPLAKSATP